MSAAMQARAIDQTRVMAAKNALAEDPRKALEMVSSISDPAKQAEILSAVARSVSERDPGQAKAVLGYTASVNFLTGLTRTVEWFGQQGSTP